jgi:hypothetical protein
MSDLVTQQAVLCGQARRISAAEKAEMELQARPAILRATVHVTRAATGKVETYELVGTADEPKEP